TASVAPSLTIHGTGAVLVGATHEVDAKAIATGLAYNISTSSSDALVGAAVSFNYVKLDSKGTIGDNTTVTGAGVTAQAVTVPATAGLTSLPVTGVSRLDDVLTFLGIENSFSSVAASGAAGSGDYAVGGSPIIDVFDLRTRAWIGDNVTINPTGPTPL